MWEKEEDDNTSIFDKSGDEAEEDDAHSFLKVNQNLIAQAFHEAVFSEFARSLNDATVLDDDMGKTIKAIASLEDPFFFCNTFTICDRVVATQIWKSF